MKTYSQKKLRFLDEQVQKYLNNSMKIKFEAIIFQIDKFIAENLNTICSEDNQEYEKFLEQEKQEQEDLNKVRLELDDFLLDDPSAFDHSKTQSFNSNILFHLVSNANNLEKMKTFNVSEKGHSVEELA